ncbi:nitrate ABC transporter substrate-binding protein [Frondihabitans sucicola]|uniref:Nitrate ABC transporter substrate-binding protein n=1 Tax=Frondihabitans sucicola TaxID=1268041 RepID=A0ABM8GJ69_9MICO|nr:ABC transporter substrate-binding protein [Frondihabitans sucicola]BDZ48425.1 nitrate ABC transporter substrate-binding protein [Frondihabitans sucicola]
MHLNTRGAMAIGLTLAAAAALTACSSSGSGDTTTGSKATTASAAVDLSGVCPANVVIQTDWNPEADHGHLYQLLGSNYTVDASKKSVSGDLMSGGKSTGVKVEIRAGGPAIGYASVSSQMYQDKSITLGYVTTDEAVQNSQKLPTTAVMAENDISPQMIMWDPKTYPKVKTIKELGTALEKDGGVVRYFGGAAYMNYLIGNDILPKSTTDGSYDGTPSKFVVAKGKDAQQGFATAEPYIYKNEVQAWGKDVKFQLVNDTGYPIYPEAMSVRTGDLTKLSPCLKKLVPVLQQADVDYITSPATTNKLITDLVTQYNNGWVYDEGVANYAVKEMKKLKIASNGDNAYVGDMDSSRIQKVIDVDTPIYKASGTVLKPDLKPSDIFTNEFIDKSIGF